MPCKQFNVYETDSQNQLLILKNEVGVCMCVYVCLHAYAGMSMLMHVEALGCYRESCVCVCVCVCECACVYVCVCMCVQG